MFTSSQPLRVGLDIAKEVFQVHAVNADGLVVETRQLKRNRVMAWCAELPQGSVIAMESCSTSHYWARQFLDLGADVRLIAPCFVAPYRMGGRGGKNDAEDASAICEAAAARRMRFVPVKSVDQQTWAMVHRLRQGYMKDRTAAINRLRGLLAELGLIFPSSPERLLPEMPGVLDDTTNDLNPLGREAIRRCYGHLQVLDAQIEWCDKRIAEHVRQDPNARLAMTQFGVGVFTASAVAADLGDLSQFKNGRQFAAWLGLVPRQRSTGGKARLGRITKRGDAYLRHLMVMGARSALTAAPKRTDDVSRWTCQLQERVGWKKACVALANKNARHLWALLTGKAKAEAASKTG